MTKTSAAPVPADHIMGVYSRTPLAFERGEGARLYTTEGEVYLDCMAGIAVNALGHAHPTLVKALDGPAEKLWHTSNIFTIPGQTRLAKAMIDASFADVVFFTNSGSTTRRIEVAIKTARKYHWAKGQPERIDIIGFEGSFHGRSLGAINASGNPNYLEGFGPPLPGFIHLPYGDFDAIKASPSARPPQAIIPGARAGRGRRALLAGSRMLRDIRKLLR